MATETVTQLLWTGGWDSTFRLLDLLLLKNRVVQPYYLIVSSRLSFGIEIRTLRSIRNMLAAKYPDSKQRLLPTVFKDVGDLRPNPIITQQFNRLKARSHLGYQYEWLAAFANETELHDLELSIHKDDKAHGFLEDFVTYTSDPFDSFYQLQDKPPDPDLQLFQYFRFPLFNKTKLDMDQISRQNGFAEIMEQTWFCHKPLRNGKPCGTCNPCRYTREEGLSRRISASGQLRYLAYRMMPSPTVRSAVSKLLNKRQQRP